ncbi:hypothetical protein E1B28_006844 [Marasmius oreades]|uniref:Uncharacterized protein n=1 Tax=Marasmius oreades TaxID=181124 RepID=A0A9P7UWW2_9AGAR|nr:uncharacterized protein E1B28_006844 [Marasmius oreades]KAG7096171.1 hypothetical protein E1B28_006844 [Marasmius oreades]
MPVESDIAQFLDIEAGVDEQEENDTDGEESDDDDFIVPDDDGGQTQQFTPVAHDNEGTAREEFDEFLGSLLNKRGKASTPASISNPIDPPGDMHMAKEAMINVRPPLWKRHKEYVICHFALMHSIANTSPSPISSIFFRSVNDGYVIVETMSPGQAAKLLAGHLSVLHGQPSQPEGINMTILDDKDTDTILDIPPGPLETPGTWARLIRHHSQPKKTIRGSTFDGDPCIIQEVRWPFVQALVIPYLEKFEAKLTVDVNDFGAERSFNGLHCVCTHVRYLRLLTGSLWCNEAKLFLASGHQFVLKHFPKVPCWEFYVGERVQSCRSGIEGIITSITSRGVEYSAKNGEICFGGWSILKDWRLGDYIRHYEGREGWVVKSHKRGVRVILKAGNSRVERVERFSGHINSFVATSPPYNWQSSLLIQPMTLNNQPSIGGEITAAWTFCCLWKWWEVVVWRGKYRGPSYRIFDVILSPQTASGMKFLLETTIVNSLSPRVVVNYDDVVDRKTLLPLHIIQAPAALAFRPGALYRHPAIYSLKSIVINPSPPSSRPVTPPPPPVVNNGTSVAWDPSYDGTETYPQALGPQWEGYHSSQRPFLVVPRSFTEGVNFTFSVKVTGESPVSTKAF